MEVLFEFADEGEMGLDEIQNELNLYQKIIDDIERMHAHQHRVGTPDIALH